MTRNKLVRILCIALVAVTLSLALILAVAVIGGNAPDPATFVQKYIPVIGIAVHTP